MNVVPKNVANGSASQALPDYELQLFIAGASTRSVRAVANLCRICEDRLAGRYNLEVVDIYQQPDLAKQEEILASPTLIKKRPLPYRRLVGDMSDHGKVLLGLAIDQPSSGAA